MIRSKSKVALKEARKYMPGGVNSPVRSFSSLDSNPPFIHKSRGSSIEDIDGNTYIDYCLSWGVFIQGHTHPLVNERAIEAIENGSSFGIPTLSETRLATKLVKHIPSIEKVRLVNSGTEAVMSAIRLARAYTGRDLIVKFDGCYHGHSDSMLVKAGSGLAGKNLPSSTGLIASEMKQTISLPFNDIDAIVQVFTTNPNTIAAVITEPIAANMGLVLPAPEFLATLQKLCKQNNSLLIFDEVVTGFRTGLSGLQGEMGITPDISCLGKIIGGGFPIGAYGGKKEIMQRVAPDGDMYQAGTLAGNPVAVAAGLATLELLEESGFYKKLYIKAEGFGKELQSIATSYGIQCNRFHSMYSLFFTDQAVIDYARAKKTDEHKFRKFYLSLLDKGIYLSPSAFETNFISMAHSREQLSKTLEIIESTLKKIQK